LSLGNITEVKGKLKAGLPKYHSWYKLSIKKRKKEEDILGTNFL